LILIGWLSNGPAGQRLVGLVDSTVTPLDPFQRTDVKTAAERAIGDAIDTAVNRRHRNLELVDDRSMDRTATDARVISMIGPNPLAEVVGRL
jgi:hypothetical protein